MFLWGGRDWEDVRKRDAIETAEEGEEEAEVV